MLSGGFLPTLWLPPPGNHMQDVTRKLFSCLLMFMKQLIEPHYTTNFPDFPVTPTLRAGQAPNSSRGVGGAFGTPVSSKVPGSA